VSVGYIGKIHCILLLWH